MSEPWITVVRTPRRRVIDDLALLLAAEGVAHQIDTAAGGWLLRVPLAQFGDAAAALAAREGDLSGAPEDLLPAPGYGPTRVGIGLAITVLALHGLVAFSAEPERWLRLGRSSASRILDGEWWRCVTALTLHSGPLHAVSNAVAFAVFGSFLGRMVGPGVALGLAVATGALGNFINVLWRGAPHLSIGASTAVFGMVGTLAGLQAQRYRRRAPLSRRAWVPLAGGVALLAMLGSAPESDFVAHVAGLVVGVLLSPAVYSLTRAPVGGRIQKAIGLAAVATVIGSWLIAWATP